MNFEKTKLFATLSSVNSRMRGKWLAAISANVIIAFLIFAVTDLINVMPMFGVPIVGFALLGQIVFTRKLLNDEPYKLEDLFADYKVFVPAFLATALLIILLSVGFALLIIPGVFVLLNYSFALHALQDNKEAGALEAFATSRKLAKGNRFKIGMFFVIFLILAVLMFALGLAFSLIPNLIWGTNLLLYAGIISGVLSTLFLTPLFVASITLFYDELKQDALHHEEEVLTQEVSTVEVTTVEVEEVE